MPGITTRYRIPMYVVLNMYPDDHELRFHSMKYLPKVCQLYPLVEVRISSLLEPFFVALQMYQNWSVPKNLKFLARPQQQQQEDQQEKQNQGHHSLHISVEGLNP